MATVRDVDSEQAVEHVARLGLIAYGIVHLIVAVLALQLVVGDSSSNASQSGAFAQLAQNPLGLVALFGVAAGFLALVIWQGFEAWTGHEDSDGMTRHGKRLVSAGRVVIYAMLGYSAVSTAWQGATGAAKGGGKKSTDSMTAQVMSAPGGELLVGLFGAGAVIAGGVLVYRGVVQKFSSTLDTSAAVAHERIPVKELGRVGYIAKGVSLAAIGMLFVVAAVQHQPKESGGLDVALHELLRQPFGAVIVAGVGLGLGAYGLFCFAWARHMDR